MHIQTLIHSKLLNDESLKNLLWAKNIALPLNYEFILIATGLCGSSALVKFLQACKIGLCDEDLKTSAKGLYFEHFKSLQTQASYKIISYIEHWSLNLKQRANFFARASKKVPVLFLVRDPISMLKTAINHPSSDKARRVLKLNEDFSPILNMKKYYINGFASNALNNKKILGQAPNLHSLPKWINELIFCQNFFVKILKHHKIMYIDMNELMPDKAFDTLNKLALEFAFQTPKKDELLFKAELNGKLITYFPIFLELPLKNKAGKAIKIILSTHQIHPYLKHCNELLDEKDLAFENMLLYLAQDELELVLKENELLKQIKSYLQDFLKSLKERINTEQNKLYKEEDILNYLFENKALSKKLFYILQNNLKHIKQNRADIVSSWKYYQEFMDFAKHIK
ncbi:hypothetical protein DMB95_02150 [Campylobacter sp. MIT 12-8780]|uniref:DUF2972 domain-containing protein n=1 Tax=unclassified Campylobacter TaxID=2593542 RepID=UPI00115DE461|nr:MULTISPECIES: DUF2972 domain-containing protein [unclassified Campylobacter]NDJ26734.1 DUF2972 domain-containing protein [Campylobacter sp. MIT 19-121]TQR42439.1 hypothetical protein DMB95_02150 [Campylobacter sp. MIT 12-8780]